MSRRVQSTLKVRWDVDTNPCFIFMCECACAEFPNLKFIRLSILPMTMLTALDVEISSSIYKDMLTPRDTVRLWSVL